MKIRELFKSGRPLFSFEVFPPKRDGDLEGLFAAVEELKGLKPDFISVTYGAAGTSRERTQEIALRLKAAGVLPLMHLTCVGHSRDELAALVDKLRLEGIENILALRGDPPKGDARFVPASDGFRYANELVAFIKNRHPDLGLAVAGYPETHVEAVSAAADIQALKLKCDAGADFVTTQLFFDNADYFAFVQRAREEGLELPILPGIMPVLDVKSLQRFAGFGTKVPAKLAEGFELAGSDADRAREFGLSWAIDQCRGLLKGGAPGLHLYAMNKAWASVRIHQALKEA